MANVDIIVRVESTGGIKDMPSYEKNIAEPKYPRDGRVKPINVPNIENPTIALREEEIQDLESLTRLEIIKEQNKQIIAASDFILAEISKRMKGKDVVVEPATHPDIIDSLNYLFGPGHNGKITFDMYQQLKEFIYDYGRLKTIGAMDGAV